MIGAAIAEHDKRCRGACRRSFNRPRRVCATTRGAPITLYRVAEARVLSINSTAALGNVALPTSDEPSGRVACHRQEGRDDRRRLGHHELPRVPHHARTAPSAISAQARVGSSTCRTTGSPTRCARKSARGSPPARRHVLLSGMIGSRQGWKEAPYLPCPAGAPEIAAALVAIAVRLGAGEAGAGSVRRPMRRASPR